LYISFNFLAESVYEDAVSHIEERIDNVSVYENCKDESEMKEEKKIVYKNDSETSSPIVKKSVFKKNVIKQNGNSTITNNNCNNGNISFNLVQHLSPLLSSRDSVKEKHEIQYEESMRVPCCMKKGKCIIF
jgi:hypothetical protein